VRGRKKEMLTTKNADEAKEQTGGSEGEESRAMV
jgi:hypothetical protein